MLGSMGGTIFAAVYSTAKFFVANRNFRGMVGSVRVGFAFTAVSKETPPTVGPGDFVCALSFGIRFCMVFDLQETCSCPNFVVRNSSPRDGRITRRHFMH